MKYNERHYDLFSVPPDYYLAHCISADFALGAGIAAQIEARYHIRGELIKTHPGYTFLYRREFGDCIRTGRVLNLVTKLNYWHKPTLSSISGALYRMKEICMADGIKKVAMPRIACGLDKQSWPVVSSIVKDVFTDTDIEVLVCY